MHSWPFHEPGLLVGMIRHGREWASTMAPKQNSGGPKTTADLHLLGGAKGQQQAELRQKWARTQAHIAKDLSDSTRFARLHAEKAPKLAAARQQSETADWQRDFAKRELDRYRHITYPCYLRRLVTD